MFNSKRGISPLVATILLIVFAVALGGLVMSWGQDIIEEGAAGHASCLDISLKLPELGGNICQGGTGASGYVDFVIDNDSPFNIDSITLWMFGQSFDHSSIVQVTDVADSLIKPGAPLIKRANYNFLRFGDMQKLIFVPKLMIEDQPILCYDNALILDNIPRC